MKQLLLLIVGVLLVAFLAACGGQQETARSLSDVQAGDDVVAAAGPMALETVVDEQGAVSVAVTPLNISGAAPTLDFEVAMNTHSVDLGMDLATLATLTTDDGRTVNAMLWDAVPGGHHVSGVLSFPAEEAGTAVIANATKLTLTIHDVDAPERIFSWSLTN